MNGASRQLGPLTLRSHRDFLRSYLRANGVGAFGIRKQTRGPSESSLRRKAARALPKKAALGLLIAAALFTSAPSPAQQASHPPAPLDGNRRRRAGADLRSVRFADSAPPSRSSLSRALERRAAAESRCGRSRAGRSGGRLPGRAGSLAHHGIDRLQVSLVRPYNQNKLKGDKPLDGTSDHFLSLSAISDTVIEPRSIPTPVGPQSTTAAGFGRHPRSHRPGDPVANRDRQRRLLHRQHHLQAAGTRVQSYIGI